MRFLQLLLRSYFTPKNRLVVQEIQDDDEVHRWVVSPHMYEKNKLIFNKVFSFPSKYDRVESVVWSGGIICVCQVHLHGMWDAMKKKFKRRNFSFRYRGYISALTGRVRELRSKNGHAFDLIHYPIEGIWHAHIFFIEAPNVEFKRNDRNELKFLLHKAFGDIRPPRF